MPFVLFEAGHAVIGVVVIIADLGSRDSGCARVVECERGGGVWSASVVVAFGVRALWWRLECKRGGGGAVQARWWRWRARVVVVVVVLELIVRFVRNTRKQCRRIRVLMHPCTKRTRARVCHLQDDWRCTQTRRPCTRVTTSTTCHTRHTTPCRTLPVV